MKNFFILGGLFLMLSASRAYAELPAEILDRDYQSCVGQDHDQKRAAYCTCVRNNMKNWDMDTYGAVAMQAATADPTKSAQIPGKLEELAKQCIAEVSH